MDLPKASDILQLSILFFVIFDPLASFSFFIVATQNMPAPQRRKTAVLAVLVASLISYSVLVLGESVLSIFGADMHDFKIAAGAILCILGIKMSLGEALARDGEGASSSQAVAALIGTPLLTGPAAITTIIIVVKDYGPAAPAVAVTSVLIFTTLLFLASSYLGRFINTTFVRVMSTILGLITISWGVKFIRAGLLQ